MTQQRLKEDIFFEEREVLNYGYITYATYCGGVELWVYNILHVLCILDILEYIKTFKRNCQVESRL